MQNNLSPEKHINKIFGETYNMLRNVRVAFHYMDKEMMKKIISTPGGIVVRILASQARGRGLDPRAG